MYAGATPQPIEPGLRENRGGERMRSLFAIGKLVHDGRQYICRVRNISDGGVGIRIEQPPEPGARVLISLRGLTPTEAEVRWIDGENAGHTFCRPISTMHIGDDTGLTPRSPRFDLARPARLSIDEVQSDARVVDISLGGMKLATATAIPVGTMVEVAIETDTLRGRICWNSATAAGLRFVAPLPLSRLAAILS